MSVLDSLINTGGGGFQGSSSAKSGASAGPSPIDIAIGAPQRAELTETLMKWAGFVLVVAVLAGLWRSVRG